MIISFDDYPSYPNCPSDDWATCPYFCGGKCTIDGGPHGQCDDYDYFSDEFDLIHEAMDEDE